MERLGVFGGTFDPPHVGHLALAEWARERLRLDRVLFVPAGNPPHKRGARLSSAAERLAMIRLAVRGHAAFEVSTIELEGPAPSYTVETVRRLTDRCPGRRWFLLMGADSLEEFPTWREPRGILKLATLAVAGRVDDAGLRGGRSMGRPETRGARVEERLEEERVGVGAAGRIQGASLRRSASTPAWLAGRIVWLDSPLIEVSSTLIRARVRAGRSIRYLVPDPVARYVARHRLYRRGR